MIDRWRAGSTPTGHLSNTDSNEPGSHRADGRSSANV